MAEISVLICTLNDRITSVADLLLPPDDDVHYLVSFQYTDNMFLDMLPGVLKERDDVTILPFPATGLSANRNNTLRYCSTPYALVSDDDIRYEPQQFHRIIDLFRSCPEVDILRFADRKLAFRVRPELPVFDTRFGIGSAYLSCGEEEVFLHQSAIYGLRILHVADPLVGPAAPTPWERFLTDKRVRRSWGALQYMKYNTFRTMWRIVMKSYHSGVTFRQRWQVFRDLFDGFRYIYSHPLNDSVADEIPFDFQPIDIWRMP